MKKRIFTLMMLLVAATFAAEATPIDLRSAREVAVKFMKANSKAPLRRVEDLQLATTYNISRGDAAFYIFNTPNGFVIISADDCATPILGYSDEGQFDVENIPIQLQEYLNDFVEQIQYGIENQIEANEQTAYQWELVRTTGRLNENRDGDAVEPLITALWGQGCYYNEKCPEDENGECGHAVTGCVATAMAQIMHYWGYPENGTGSYSYTPSGYPEQYVDFGSTTYNWSNMPNRLYASSTSEQIDAVATLSWHCGVAVKMSYGPNASGAFSGWVRFALTDYFGYSNELSYEYRANYPDAIWKAKLKDCLNLGRPIYYSGSGASSGHAFVCDGYDASEMFHFNWGWSGMSNGYFAIGALYGYSGIFFDFNDDNNAVFNIHPQGETTNYVINVSAKNVEGGNVSGGGTFAHGSNVTLSATANSGYCFCYWEENGGIASTNPNYSFTANYNRNLEAVFAEPFTVTVSASEGGTASGGGTFAYGETCTVTASPYGGYCFANWTKNGNVVSVDANYSFPVTGESNMTAHFVQEGNIAFADTIVKAICVNNWDTNGDGELSFGEAAAVMSFGEVFRGNTEITSFEELQYFISLTSIDNFAFSGCSNLTGSLYIPNSVIYIGDYAFNNCSGFDGELHIGNSVTKICNKAFYCCSGFTGSLIIPNSVTMIGDNAFISCRGFTGSLSLPDSLAKIGKYTFSNCSGFTGSLTLPSTLTSIGEYAFNSCSGFTGSLSLPNAITSIGNRAFYNCSGFTGSLTLSNALVSIGDYAFYGCSGFTGSLTIPDSVISIGNSAFNSCSGFTGALTIGNSVVSIGNSAFSGCVGFIGNLTIGNSVTSIGSFAFSGCSGLTGPLTIPNSVTSLENHAFNNCSGFTGPLTISNSLTSINGNVFYGCSGLTGSLTIPNSVTSIGNYAFYNCSGLTGSLTIPDAVTSIGQYTFCHCNGFTGSLTIGNSVISIGNYAFNNCNGFTGSLTIGNSVASIGNYAFYNCSGFTGPLTLSNSLISIGNCAFYNCNNFTSLTFSNSITGIGEYAFSGCSGLMGQLILPNTLTSMGYGAFYGCSGFTSLTLPNAINAIESSTFSGCSGLTGSPTIPNSVMSIGNNAFSDCSNLIGPLILPNSVTYIGYGAFRNCSGLSSLTLPDSINLIEGSVFYGCSGLKGSLTIPNSVTSIGSYAFYGCNGLTGSLTLPNAITSLGNYAFYGCSGLSSMIVLADTPPTGASNAFYAISTSFPVYVHCESVETYQSDAGWSRFSNIIGMCSSGTITVAAEPVEGGVVTGDGTYDEGTYCTVTATPNENFTFMYWTENGIVVSTQAEYTFVVPTDRDLVAHFSLPFSVTAVANPTEGGTVTGGGGSYCYGTPITLTATANEGYCFYYWTESGTVVSSNASFSFPVVSNMNLVANFGSPLNITAIANSEEGSTVSGGGTYVYNQTCTLTAIPNDGYVFTRWTKDGTVVSSLSSFSFPVTDNSDYVAEFDYIYPNVVVGDAQSVNMYLPSSYNYYSLSEQIYTSNEIGRACVINSLSFFNAGSSKTRNYSIYLVHTDKSSFGSRTDWIPVTTSDQVFCGNVTLVSNNWTEITLDTSFYYNGTSNLVLVVDDNTGSYSYGMECRVFSAGINKAISVYNSSTNFDPYNPSEYNGICYSVKNQIIFGITPPSTMEQTCTLAQGWNWFSANVEVTLDDLKAALVEALPGTSITIKSNNDGQAMYNGFIWVGALSSLDVTQMYKISVNTDCEISLEGIPVNPVNHPVTITNGTNWIGFPLGESMAVANAFAGFPINGDFVKSKSDGQASWNGRMWVGGLQNLAPGNGYIYISNAAEDRTFTFPTGTGKAE